MLDDSARSDSATHRRRRAVVHAALADESRLAIVDALALGDLSPSALAEELRMRSNLLAHHVRVLVDAGVVTRARSEGDRRRTYVRLATSDPVVVALAQLPRAGAPDRVVFVCTRNSARSQLATAIWRGLDHPTDAASAGTHPADRVHPQAVTTARRHGLDLPDTGGTARIADVVRDDDLVVAVCDAAHETLSRIPGAREPELHWSVPDPVGRDDAAAFEDAFADLSGRVHRLAAAIPASPTQSADPTDPTDPTDPGSQP